MRIKEELSKIVGAEHVSDDPEELKVYSEDHSLSPARMPNYMARPQGAAEIQKIVELANEHCMPVIPVSSGVHFDGMTVPSQGGIVLDLKRMNRILDIDERNRKARIEPGVTWGQLQTELEKQGLMPLFPLLPHPLKSALTSHLEREPILIPKFEFGEPLLTTEAVFPKGEIFRTGAATAGFGADTTAKGAFPHGPGLDWWRLFQGAQGTMGILTWGNVKVELLPEVNKTFFMPFERAVDAIELMYRVGRKMIGYEFFLVNRFNLAAILTEKWPDDFETLEGILPPWTVILVLSGGPVRPGEKIEYEEEALREIAFELSLANVLTSLPGLPGLERKLVNLLRKPWSEDRPYWKWACKGECQDLFFLTTLDRVSDFVEAVGDIAARYGYPIADVGCYVQPLEYSRACHCEFNFYYDPDDPIDVARIRRLYADAAEIALGLGALFTRPYGILADLVYPRATGYTMMLKKVKGVMDPRNIMNPGKLCF